MAKVGFQPGVELFEARVVGRGFDLFGEQRQRLVEFTLLHGVRRRGFQRLVGEPGQRGDQQGGEEEQFEFHGSDSFRLSGLRLGIFFVM
ncbi:hypothetical protein SDC9_194017 [bioreactor metagenome]|uniref:Uncharacterized protein n=1 Tax=bioreactor metagenome TaxID=1076179 RepID=A0A645I554_9ZZZZ